MALGIFIGLALYGLLDMGIEIGRALRADIIPKPRYRRRPDIEVVTSDNFAISHIYFTPYFEITVNPN